MQQSSLMTWFKKPAAVTAPPATAPAPAPARSTTTTRETGPFEPTASQPALIHDPTNEGDKHSDAPSHTSTVSPTSVTAQGLPPLLANVELRACNASDIPSFKRLNSLLLPIPYPEAFYRETMEDAPTRNITLLALWHDRAADIGKEKGILVGAIRCRILPQPVGTTDKAESPKMLYLSTLVLLSPYRHHGIASHLLAILTARAVREYGVSSVGAHVWESNAEGREWYQKRGFRESGREEAYYRKLKPQTAVVMKRTVSVKDLLGNGG